MNTIDEFLNNYPSKKTNKAYKTVLNGYFRIIKANPNTYFDRKREYEKDIEKYWQHLIKEKRPPLSIKQKLMVVKTFLDEYEVIIPKKTWKKFRRKTKGTRAATMDSVPTNNQLKKILSHGKAMERALFLIASSSGIRIDTLLQLESSDIYMDNFPAKITIPGRITKSGNPRISFMSNEAKAALEEFMKVRDEYLTTAVARSKNKPHIIKSSNDPTIFPCSYYTARVKWNRMITKAGYGEKDKTTDRYKMHIHTLRKFFRTRMALEIPLDVVEALMGHEGYLTQAYRRYDERQLADMYQKGMHTVAVFEIPPDLTDVNEKLVEKDKQIDELKYQMEVMRNQMNQLMADKLISMDKQKKKDHY